MARKRRAGQFVIVRVEEAGERIPLTIVDVLGPLGNPTPVERYGEVACVGGGVGTAELFPIARALAAAGNRVHAILGGRTRELVILEREMRACSESLRITTDDGSRGRNGVVTDALGELLEERPINLLPGEARPEAPMALSIDASCINRVQNPARRETREQLLARYQRLHAEA